MKKSVAQRISKDLITLHESKGSNTAEYYHIANEEFSIIAKRTDPLEARNRGAIKMIQVGQELFQETYSKLCESNEQIDRRDITIAVLTDAIKNLQCESCKDLGWYGDNCAGRIGNSEYAPCDNCSPRERAIRQRALQAAKEVSDE